MAGLLVGVSLGVFEGAAVSEFDGVLEGELVGEFDGEVVTLLNGFDTNKTRKSAISKQCN